MLYALFVVPIYILFRAVFILSLQSKSVYTAVLKIAMLIMKQNDRIGQTLLYGGHCYTNFLKFYRSGDIDFSDFVRMKLREFVKTAKQVSNIFLKSTLLIHKHFTNKHLILYCRAKRACIVIQCTRFF